MLGAFIVKVANLAEAEGRAAKRGAIDTAAAICVQLAATAIGVSGLWAIAVGIYFLLTEGLALPRWGAWLIVGGFLLGLGATCLWKCQHMCRTTPSQGEQRCGTTLDRPTTD